MGLFDSFKRDRNSRKSKQEVSSPAAPAAKEVQDSGEVQEINQLADAAAVAAEEQPVEQPVDEQETPSASTGPTESEEVAYRPIKSYDQKERVTHVVGQTKTVAIINQKGGVGKSTTAINLSAALGERGKQVLLVDLDPQGNTSSGLGIEKSRVENCIYDVLLDDVPLEQVIIPDVCPGLDLVPATINLAGAEVELVSEMARENRLKDALGRFKGKYDYIFIDCPPSLGLLTVNALVAADKLLIPIQCEFYALEGVTKLLDSMKRVKTRLNPSLDIYGVLLTMYDGRTILAKQVAEEVRNYFGKKVFDTLIPRTVKLSEAPSFGMPITQYDPSGKGADSYSSLAEEVIARG